MRFRIPIIPPFLFPPRFLSTIVVRKRYRDLWAFISLIWLSSSTCWICTWKQILENKKLSRNSSWLFIQKRCDNQLNFYPNNLLLSPKKGWKMISMLLVWDPTTKLEFSFKIIRSDFVGEAENGSLKHGNSEIRRARKTLVVGSLLLHGGLAQPKWHWPASLKIGICLIEMFVPLVFFHLSKIRALHEEPIFVHSAMHLNGSEMVKGGLLRRNWRTHYHKRSFWHGRRNLRK